MEKRKYRIEIPVDWIMGHLRYGHFEGIVELTDEELQDIKNGIMTPREVACELDLNLIIDDYRVDDMGDYQEPIVEEVNE